MTFDRLVDEIRVQRDLTPFSTQTEIQTLIRERTGLGFSNNDWTRAWQYATGTSTTS